MIYYTSTWPLCGLMPLWIAMVKASPSRHLCRLKYGCYEASDEDSSEEEEENLDEIAAKFGFTRDEVEELLHQVSDAVLCGAILSRCCCTG